MKMKKQNKILIISEFKELQELKAKADKRIKELKDQIQKEFDAGIYGQYFLNFETREVREYVVPARIDHIVKISKI